MANPRLRPHLGQEAGISDFNFTFAQNHMPCGLPEGDPESVDVTNSELTHAVESIIEVHHDLNPVLEASVQLIDVLGGDVQVDLATVLRARFPLIGT